MLRLRTLGGLWIEAADGARLASLRPRRLGLLAIVAAAGPRGVSRSRVRAIFWPDATDEAAGHALRQTLYALNQDLGIRPVQAERDLRLDPAVIASDLDEFHAAIARRDWHAVDQLYLGPFAAGFSLDDLPEFDRWVDDERAALARKAESAIEALARESAAAADPRAVAQAWKRLTALDPLSAHYAASYMHALAALGDRSGAIAHGKRYAADVRRELDADPDAIVVKLADELRLGLPPEDRPAPPHSSVAEQSGPAASPRVEPLQTSTAGTSWARQRVGAAVLTLAVAAGVIGFAASRPSRSTTPVMAVGDLRDLTAPDAEGPAGTLIEVLTTSIARLADAEVIANSRILELLPSGGDTVRSARIDAARRAGATEVIEGELIAAGDGRLRLNLRRIEIRRGAIQGGYSVTGSDPLALIDSATVLLASDLSISRPRQALAELTARSPLALRLYEEGLRAYYRGDRRLASARFREALAEDSTFAMAAFYAFRVGYDVPSPDQAALGALALRLSNRAPDRDGLIIRAAIGGHHSDPAAVLVADSLATRFPRDPEALVRAAEVMGTHRLIGPREREFFERAIAIDSAAGLNLRAPCRLCDALFALTRQLDAADSGQAAEQVIRRWIRFLPGDPYPVVGLAGLHFQQGRYEAAMNVLAEVERSDSAPNLASGKFIGHLLTGRLDEPDAQCQAGLGQNGPTVFDPGPWLCAIVWRNQGRYQDASTLVFSRRLPDGRALPGRLARDFDGEYVLDFEMGRPRLAMKALESVAPTEKSGLPPGLLARTLAWNLTRRGTAAVMAREIDLARRLADSAEVAGRGSMYGRDPLLHYFIRGLMAQSANDHETAVDLFRRSILSWTFGYTRANFELARSLLVLGRASEAIPPLQAALRGGWDGSNLYVTRTELHELLAQAFDAAGRRDSAAAHYATVERAWRRADPPFAARYRAASDYLARTGERR